MRHVAVIAGLTVIVLTGAGCSGDEPVEGQSGKNAQTAAAATPSIGPAELPQEPAALVEVIARRVRAARTLHASVAIETAAGGGRRVREEATAQVRTDGQSPTAQITIVESAKSEPFATAPVAVSLDGVQVRRYRGTTPTAAMATAAKAFQQMAESGLKEVSWTLWVDGNGVPRKFAATLAGPDGRRLASTATYTDWGKPVTIGVPPPGQTATPRD